MSSKYLGLSRGLPGGLQNRLVGDRYLPGPPTNGDEGDGNPRALGARYTQFDSEVADYFPHTESKAVTIELIPHSQLKEFAWDNEAPLEMLVHRTLREVVEDGAGRLLFKVDDGAVYALHHIQDCCESVHLEDVCGDLADLVGSPMVLAEEVCGDPPPRKEGEGDHIESETWTFYRFATVKGTVTLRWHGTSNGYYSESVSFGRVE